jgi:hypothetical protein
MTAQVSDVADDYSAAAKRLRGGSATASRQAVDARVAEQARLFGGQPRDAVEKVIDACPQLNG